MEKIKNSTVILAFIVAPYLFLRMESINFTLFDLLLLILGIITLFQDYKMGRKHQFFYVFVFSFLLFSIASIFNSNDQIKALIASAQYFFILLVLFPTIEKTLNPQIYKKSVFIMSVCWSLLALFNLTLISDQTYYYGGRFMGIFSKSSELGFITLLMTPFLLYSLAESKNLKGVKGLLLKFVLLLGSLTNVYLLLESGSRSALLSLVVGLVLLLVLRYGLSFKFLLISSIFVVIGIVSINLLSDDLDRNGISRLTKTENYSVRVQDYEKSYDVLSNDFLIGTGLHTSGSQIIGVGGDHRPHNIFIDFLLETGIVGLISMIGILWLSLGWGLKLLFQVLFKNKRVDLLVSATLAAGFSILLYQQFTTVSVHRVYWLVWALCFWMSMQREYSWIDNKKRRKIVW